MVKMVSIKNMDKPKTDDLIKMVAAARGNVSDVARKLDKPRSTVQHWIDASANATRALDDARETRVDVAETVVYKAAAEEALTAAFYILNNDPRAKKRGWGVQRFEHTGDDGGPIKFVVEYVNNRKDHTADTA